MQQRPKMPYFVTVYDDFDFPKRVAVPYVFKRFFVDDTNKMIHEILDADHSITLCGGSSRDMNFTSYNCISTDYKTCKRCEEIAKQYLEANRNY